MANIIEQFLNECDCSKSTLNAYRHALQYWQTWLAGRGPEEATRADIIAYKKHLQQSNHKPATINLYLSAIRSLYNWAGMNGYCGNIAIGIKQVKRNTESIRHALTPNEVTAVLMSIDRTTLRGMRDYAMLLTMFSTALRCVEVSRLNKDDLQHVSGHWVLCVQGKGCSDNDNYIAINAELAACLQEYFNARRDNGAAMFASCSHNHDNDYRMQPHSISQRVKAIFSAAGIGLPGYSAHSTRHTAITVALMSGASLREVQQYARHKNINTTLIYDHSLQQLDNPCCGNVMRLYTNEAAALLQCNE